MMNDYIVINRSAAGDLVAVVVTAWSAQEAVTFREKKLRGGGFRCDIVAVTESVPGPWGTGGRVLREVHPEPRPSFIVTDELVRTL